MKYINDERIGKPYYVKFSNGKIGFGSVYKIIEYSGNEFVVMGSDHYYVGIFPMSSVEFYE